MLTSLPPLPRTSDITPRFSLRSRRASSWKSCRSCCASTFLVCTHGVSELQRSTSVKSRVSSICHAASACVLPLRCKPSWHMTQLPVNQSAQPAPAPAQLWSARSYWVAPALVGRHLALHHRLCPGRLGLGPQLCLLRTCCCARCRRLLESLLPCLVLVLQHHMLQWLCTAHAALTPSHACFSLSRQRGVKLT